MAQRSVLVFAATAALLLGRFAHAQGVPAPTAPEAVTPEAPASPDDAENPALQRALPDVKDPMLAPVAPARHVLGSWPQALKLVRSRTTALQQAKAQVKQAIGQRRQAVAGALPSLTGDAALNHHLLRGQGFNINTGTFSSLPDPVTAWNAGLTLRVPLLAPQSWQATRVSDIAIRAARLSEKEAERLVLGSVADAIVSVVTAERLSEVSRVSLRSALSTLDLTQRRARLGVANAVDVLRAEQEVATSRAQVISADEQVRRARENLGLALGYAEPWGVTPNISLNQLASEAKAVCQAQASVETRPDVLAARASVEVAEGNLDTLDWSYAPKIDGVSNLRYWSNNFTANREQVTWTIGAVLTWTLYDGGLRYGQRQVNEAQLQDARARLVETRRKARTEARQAVRAVKVSEANLQVSRQAREIAFRTARLARIAFVNGTGTSFDLVDTARRLREAELDLAVGEFELLRSKIAAFLALANCDI